MNTRVHTKGKINGTAVGLIYDFDIYFDDILL